MFIQKHEKLKVEKLYSIQEAIQPGDWLITLALKDAYFNIAILTSFQTFLCFAVGLGDLQYTACAYLLASLHLLDYLLGLTCGSASDQMKLRTTVSLSIQCSPYPSVQGTSSEAQRSVF